MAAWPAASLVGSYELLLWLIRSAAADAVAREPTADQADELADRPVAALRLIAMSGSDASAHLGASGNNAKADLREDRCAGPVVSADRTNGPGRPDTGPMCRSASQTTDRSAANGASLSREFSEGDINVEAVAAFRASMSTSRPRSERKIAAMFGKTSRRWARNRMAEARQATVPAMADSQ